MVELVGVIESLSTTISKLTKELSKKDIKVNYTYKRAHKDITGSIVKPKLIDEYLINLINDNPT